MDEQIMLNKLLEMKNFQQSKKMYSYKDRVNSLKKLYNNIKEMMPEIVEALQKDLCKSEIESYMTEIGFTLNEISFMCKKCKKYSKTRKVLTPLAQFHAKSYEIPCPYGCVLVLSPWNYPFMLSIVPIVDAVAAGNSVLLKPSEISPNTSTVLAKLIEKTFEKGHVEVVEGGKEESTFLLEQDFDYIFYTGSTRVGKIVMQKASENFTPVTLELGGKCPCVVDETADLKLSARRIVFGKFLNCGQTCVAPDYVFCHKDIKDELVKEIERQIVIQYGVTPLTNKDYPKLINEKQFNTMKSFINEDNLLFGGRYDENTLKIEPTLIKSTFEDESMQDEIFGPILPIVTFENLDEAIKNINSYPKPLALYIFSSSKQNQEKVLKYCDFGGGCINDTIIHIASNYLGFGGLKQSGMGAYHGKVGFDTFTHYKSIVDKKRWIDLPIRYQPYNKLKYKLIKMFMK